MGLRNRREVARNRHHRPGSDSDVALQRLLLPGRDWKNDMNEAQRNLFQSFETLRGFCGLQSVLFSG